MDLTGKKALVSGASQGIGRAICDRYLDAGAELWGLDIKEGEDLKGRIDRAKGKLHWIIADIGRIHEVEDIIERAIKESGGFDILVNNAGITRDNLSFRMSI